MKRFFACFAVFAALVFVVSCGGSSSKPADGGDTGETVTDGDTADSEPADDSEPSDTVTDEDGDTANSGSTGDSEPSDTEPDNDADSGDTAPDSDDEEPINENPDNLPECSPTSATPCKDSSSGLTWSAKASSAMTWQNAVDYCNSYSEGGLSGWHLPNINELRTLIKNCAGSQTGGSCAVQDPSCLSSSCNSSSCYCSYMENNGGYYSKLGDDDTVYLWSSSTYVDSTNGAWGVYFYGGRVDGSSKADDYYVRCVR